MTCRVIKPGTRHRHRRLVKEDFVRARCEIDSFEKWRTFVALERKLTGGPWKASPAFQHKKFAKRPALCHRRQRRHLLWPGCYRAQPGSTMVMGIANLAMATATLAVKVWASTRCAVRTTFRARATWALSRTNSLVTVTCRTIPYAISSNRTGRGLAERARSAHSEHV